MKIREDSGGEEKLIKQGDSVWQLFWTHKLKKMNKRGNYTMKLRKTFTIVLAIGAFMLFTGLASDANAGFLSNRIEKIRNFAVGAPKGFVTRVTDRLFKDHVRNQGHEERNRAVGAVRVRLVKAYDHLGEAEKYFAKRSILKRIRGRAQLAKACHDIHMAALKVMNPIGRAGGYFRRGTILEGGLMNTLGNLPERTRDIGADAAIIGLLKTAANLIHTAQWDALGLEKTPWLNKMANGALTDADALNNIKDAKDMLELVYYTLCPDGQL